MRGDLPPCVRDLPTTPASSLQTPAEPQMPAAPVATGDVGGVQISTSGGITVIALNSGIASTQNADIRVDMTVAPGTPAAE